MVRLSKINTNAPLFKKFNTPLRLFPFGKGLFLLLFVCGIGFPENLDEKEGQDAAK
jgi:hypothetical protein